MEQCNRQVGAKLFESKDGKNCIKLLLRTEISPAGYTMEYVDASQTKKMNSSIESASGIEARAGIIGRKKSEREGEGVPVAMMGTETVEVCNIDPRAPSAVAFIISDTGRRCSGGFKYYDPKKAKAK